MPVAMLPTPERLGRHRSTPARLLAFHRPAEVAGRFFLPQLDALRLLAFLMVWSCHSLPSAAECIARGLPPAFAGAVEVIKETGNLGVPVFFFLSAYLITELLRRELLTTGTIAVRDFYIRRALRIWPLYFGVLLVYGLLGLRFHGFRIETGRIVASVLMVGNWYIAFHPGILTPMRALWSLSVEEQFYAAWPLLARWCSRQGFLAVCGLLLVGSQCSLALLAVASSQPAQLHVTAWVNSFVQFQFFAWGALLALLLGGRKLPRLALPLRAALLASGLAAMLCAAGVFHIKHPQAIHSPASLCAGYGCAGLGCLLLFGAALTTPGHLVSHAVQKLGQVSFGLYVFHETGFFLADAILRPLTAKAPHSLAAWLLLLVCNKVFALALTVVMALASYYLWEKPFLRLKERFTRVRSREA